ncbi:hypothetical protein BP6252_13600 [Coleophoma cylindrospora]|uniref:Dol-P-Glc:Glc(2)Man(9)GlcNAc(2)-PP-Dol alpha-1,2-glucosyltransferase n=1 Tax=Coleophoma cylindrospora TaxID=1849047 RepID=A0A3D8Q8Q6_9HELO|nr:hypothetical protein BP6252_13600 [Coleophoma cylindrospora]
MTTSWNPISWLSGTALLEESHAPPAPATSPIPKGKKILIALIYGSVIVPAWFWVSQVTTQVPEPYLDEVFHIPQARAYCDGKYGVWDPKLTTPPGLYGFATLFAKLVGGGVCNVYTLRLFNTVVLLLAMAYASACRDLISRLSRTAQPFAVTRAWLNSHAFISLDTVHTAVNIALFPPLFFFSGLFYTDVLSTAVVLCMYMAFLRRPGAYENSAAGSIRLYVIGLVALTMRQTNIFWVAVFMGGLEAVRTVKAISGASSTAPSKVPGSMEELVAAVERYKVGQIHDVELSQADIPGKTFAILNFVLCIVSIAVAILFNPILILTRLWPYIALLVSFASFVIWNGGVVLGDKSNHVATIHLPQLLYLSAFTAFFSFPLLLPSALDLLPRFITAQLPNFVQPPSTPSPKSIIKRALNLSILTLCLLVTLATIRTNTIIHPFTLADNRHYVFYVFRYTILRHPLFRYLLAPVYLLSGWLAFRTLAGFPAPASSPSAGKTSQASKALNTHTAAPQRNTAPSGPTTSFLLIFTLATALSLITAPLVEPRYFIVPWVLWRVQLPSLPVREKGSAEGGAPSRDYRLYLETVWFLAINAVTGYIFLYKGFTWVQEEGKVQRFMW